MGYLDGCGVEWVMMSDELEMMVAVRLGDGKGQPYRALT